MARLSAKLRSVEVGGFGFWCPGCGEMHVVNSGWKFGGDVNAPSFSPSILVGGLQAIFDEKGRWTGDYRCDAAGKPLPLVCHSFVTNGRIQFLSDCTHALAGQTVDLPDIPDAAQ